MRPITWAAIAGGVLAAATLALILYVAASSMQYTCEVCMNFRGQTQCREAVGKTAKEATRTATDNACAVLGARGMTLSIECSNTPPVSAECRGGDE